jgi:uncharacterized protein DUF1844
VRIFPSLETQDSTAAAGNFQASRGRRAENAPAATHARIALDNQIEVLTVSENKHEESFRVIDRRPFTTDGELRQEFVAEQEREARQEAKKEAAALPAPAPAAGDGLAPAKETPKRSAPFENLIRMLGSNGAMVLGAYTDPRTGQPVIDPDAARELIDMLDAMHEKTKGNLAPEEESLLLDLLGKLKMTYLEVSQALAAQAAQAAKAKGR